MATIGIYDYDFMTYEQVIPNLECAKLSAFNKRKKNITVLAPVMEPNRYTNFIIRKEYDDGIFPQQLFEQNVTYGGKVFNGDTYTPMDYRIERITPDFSDYERYISNFSSTKSGQETFKKIMRSVHGRLSINEKTPDCLDKLYSGIQQKSSGIILHDYNPNKIDNLYEILQDISNSRNTLRGTPKPIPIGNKFPIEVYNSEDLLKWGNIYPMDGIFFLKMQGFINNEALVELIEKNKRFCRQIYYMIDFDCKSEEDFLQNRAIDIFKQVLYYKRTNTKILLKYTDGFFKTRQLKSLIYLWNCYGAQHWLENFLPVTQTLYKYSSNSQQIYYRDLHLLKGQMNIDEIREVFKYIREHNYELFKLFYEWDAVKLKGGEFVNAWN